MWIIVCGVGVLCDVNVNDVNDVCGIIVVLNCYVEFLCVIECVIVMGMCDEVMRMVIGV